MKKLFFLAGCSALVLSSCSNEIDETGEIPLVNGAAEIRINTYAPGLTRAEAKSAFETDDKIFVSASYITEEEEDNSIINNDFTLTADGWIAKDQDGDTLTFNWPANPATTVNFYAIYDGQEHEASPIELNDEDKAIWSIEPDGETDLMAVKKTSSYNESTNGEVTLSFNHILSQITVNLKSDNNYDYVAKNVKLKAPVSATYNFDRNSCTPIIAETGTFATSNIELLTLQEDETGNRPSKDLEFTDDGVVLPTVMIIPNDKSTIEITYEYWSDGTKIDTKVVTGELGTLEIGKSYNVNVSVSQGLKTISISTTIQNWVDGTDQNINL